MSAMWDASTTTFTFGILFQGRRKMRTGPNWGNERLFKCSRTEGRPFLVVSKVNSVLGAVDFLLYGRVAKFFFRARMLIKFALGRAIINNIESRSFGRHFEVDCDVFSGVFDGLDVS
jgi:hypothetical protein